MAIPLDTYEGVPIPRLTDPSLSVAIAHVEAVKQDLVSQAQYAEGKYRPVIHDAYETALMDLSNELSRLRDELVAESARRSAS